MTYDIYFDLDGVVADYRGGLRSQLGIEYPDTRLSQEDFSVWHSNLAREVDKHSPDFWENLELIPQGKELFDYIAEIYPAANISFLSAYYREYIGNPSAYCRIRDGKTAFVRRHFGPDYLVNVVPSGTKHFSVIGVPCVLFDDDDSNLKSWAEAGGLAMKVDWTKVDDCI